MTAVAVGDPEELGKADAVVPTTDDFSYALFEETWEKARN
jgi:beta-phosphoglucomutase